MKALCSLYRIAKTRTTPYHPSGNGQAERYNQLLQMIRCFRYAREKTWDEDLQLLAGAIRAMKNRSTGFSANMLMLGSEASHPVNCANYCARLRDTKLRTYEVVRFLFLLICVCPSDALQKLPPQGFAHAQHYNTMR